MYVLSSFFLDELRSTKSNKLHSVNTFLENSYKQGNSLITSLKTKEYEGLSGDLLQQISSSTTLLKTQHLKSSRRATAARPIGHQYTHPSEHTNFLYILFRENFWFLSSSFQLYNLIIDIRYLNKPAAHKFG